MDALENKLDEALVKNAPVQLPENAKKWIVTYNPYITLVIGILGLLAAWGLWGAAHAVNDVVNTIDSAYRAYGIDTKLTRDANLGISFWIAWLSLLVQSVIMIAAYPGLKVRSKKRGWDLLFYGAIISLISGVFYGVYDSSIFSIIMRVIGSVIGFYFLFQVRSYYTGKQAKKAEVADKPAAKSTEK